MHGRTLRPGPRRQAPHGSADCRKQFSVLTGTIFHERVSLEGLDPEQALKALLAVDPDAPPVDTDDEPGPEPAERDTEK